MKNIVSVIKVISLAFVFAAVIHFSYAFFEWKNNNSEQNVELNSGLLNHEKYWSKNLLDDSWKWINQNKYKFKKTDTIILANIWVALTTNIGTRYKERQSNNLYKDVLIIGQVISEKKYSNRNSRKNHMDNIKEYYNVLRTDVKWLLDKSHDRKASLESYIAQLKYRYNSTNSNLRVLTNKQNEYARAMNISNKLIAQAKSKMTSDFKNFNWIDTEKNIENLLKAKSEYNYAKAYSTYISQYIKQYKYLNSKGKKLYDTLSQNKEIIVKNTKVVIPKTGIENLKKLELIVNGK